MKQYIILILLILSAGSLYGQFQDGPPPGGRRHQDRIAQLEKIKLLEALDLSEEKMLILFSRRDAHHDAQKKLFDQREELMKELDEKYISGDESITAEEFDKIIKKLAGYERAIAESRESYLNSLKDILSEKEIIKYIVFESKFREMVRKFIMEDRPKGTRGK